LQLIGAEMWTESRPDVLLRVMSTRSQDRAHSEEVEGRRRRASSTNHQQETFRVLELGDSRAGARLAPRQRFQLGARAASRKRSRMTSSSPTLLRGV